MSRVSQVCQASPPYWDNKKSVYMTSPLSRDEFLIYSYLHNHGILIPARQDGVFIWKIVPSQQPRSHLQQLRSWEAGQTGSLYKLNAKFYRKSGRCRDTQQGGLSQQTELARLI